MGWLEDAGAEVDDADYDVNKLSLAQLLQSRNLQIQQQLQENRSLREQNGVKYAQIKLLEEQNQSLQAENTALKQSQKVCYVLFISRIY